LLELNRHNVVRTADVAQKFEISTRTVSRYLSELESAGIPTFTKIGRNGGIGIEKNFSVEGLFLTPNDKVLLRQAVGTLPSDVRKYFAQKLSL
jgi:predicted DNA-binding transcriptional regulator YafY